MLEWLMIHKIKALYDNGKGLSKRQIAKELGISRNSISKYLNMEENAISVQKQNTERVKTLDIYQEYIVYLLKNYPNLSAVKVMRKLREKYDDITITDRTVRRYVESLKETINCKQQRYYEPILDMVPGVQCQVDPGELRGVKIGGVETTVYFVVFVLSYSRLMYVGLSSKPINTTSLIQMHDAAFRYFGGRVEECVYDQTKMVVLAEEYRELTLNQRFYEYATYAGFTIRACEGYDPESKGKVEAGVKYVKFNGLYGEDFTDWSELESYKNKWLDEIANKRCHGTTGYAPRKLYEEKEQKHMHSYNTPSIIQQDEQYIKRKADKTGLISWSSNKYSVPMIYQNNTIIVKEMDNEIIIYDTGNKTEIARHGKATGIGNIIKNPNHYRDISQLVSELEAKIIDLTSSELGTKLCILLKKTSPMIYKDQLRAVIKILSNGGNSLSQDIIDKLCQRQRLSAKSIREYLEAYVIKQQELNIKNTYTTTAEQKQLNHQLERYRQVLPIQGAKHAFH